MKVLIVEDDRSVAGALRAALVQQGFEINLAGTGAEALVRLSPPPDVILLDLQLPDWNGFSLCGRIRSAVSTPLIMVTARGDVRSRVHGLNVGADDYLVKPYNLAELIARIHAVVRRTPADETPAGSTGVLQHGDIRLDARSRKVRVGQRTVPLTRKEFEVLFMLIRTPGVAVRREQILSGVWGTDWAGAGHTLEVHMASLRHKLDREMVIQTVRGFGYRLVGSAE